MFFVPPDVSSELLRALQPQPQGSGDQGLQDRGGRAGRRGQPRSVQDIGPHAGGEGGVDQIHQVRGVMLVDPFTLRGHLANAELWHFLMSDLDCETPSHTQSREFNQKRPGQRTHIYAGD